jgi:hypothetical protein
VSDPQVDLVQFERDKIKGAVRTDFILSAEIIAITLGTVAAAPFVTQVSVLVGIALLMTVGVYGFVAGIVKLDDLGLWLSRRPGAMAQALGRGIVRCGPVADEGPVGGRHGGDVPGGRRHPGAWRAGAAPRHRPFSPAADDTIERKAGRFAALVRTVEFAAIRKAAAVVHADRVGGTG